MRLLVEINLDNDVFSMPDTDVPTPNLTEVGRCLEAVTRGINNGHDSAPIRDSNGNTVGRYVVEDSPAALPLLMICDDCGHQHGGAPHGFCKCGCTYPGWHWGEVETGV